MQRKKTVAPIKPDGLNKRSAYPVLRVADRTLGKGHPVFIVAEIGINHNGELASALALIDVAVEAGCDAVKFQKRSPERCVPVTQRDVMRETPWGTMSYLEYRHRMEFGADEYGTIDAHCSRQGILWFASCWDQPSVDFIQLFEPACYKIASACLTDGKLLRYTRQQGKPVILSTGMSTMNEIRQAVAIFDPEQLLIVHTTSNYVGNPEELNLSMILTLDDEFKCQIGYSGHETGTVPTIAAASLGACYVERHITLDRNMWGSDHSISLEPYELKQMVKDIRLVERALGDGVKRVYASEKRNLAKLRTCR
jgi:N-acetylneuraminate synthase